MQLALRPWAHGASTAVSRTFTKGMCRLRLRLRRRVRFRFKVKFQFQLHTKYKTERHTHTRRLKLRFFMLAEAACCFVCPTMLIEKTRLPDFESVVH
jgi:hypothetical protein